MAKGLRAVVAAAALGMGLLGAAGAARADETDGEYAFTYASTSSNSMTASGFFGLSGTVITKINGSFADSSSLSGPVAFALNNVIFGGLNPFNGNLYFLNSAFSNGPFDPSSNNQGAEFQGFLAYTSNTFSGNIIAIDLATNNDSSGLFTATLQNFLNPVTPGSGGGPTGGSGGSAGGGGATGAAPSPEVNTLLGLLVVGGTVAFMKRRRKDGRVEAMAAA